MRLLQVVLAILLSAPAIAKDKAQAGIITETRNDPTAMTAYTMKGRKAKFVENRRGLEKINQKPELKMGPVVVQSYDHTKTTAGLRFQVTAVGDNWTFAPILIVADGKQVYSAKLDWTTGLILGGLWRMETAIDADSRSMHLLAGAKEVFVTVTVDARAMSFEVPPEELSDIQAMADKFDELKGRDANTP